MLPKKEPFRKLVDNQFYQGNVMSIKQTLLVNNDPYENEFIQKQPQYHLQYLQLDKAKLQSINSKDSSRTRIRNSSVSTSVIEGEQHLIQQLKQKIKSLQSLLQDMFALLNKGDDVNKQAITQMHQKYISIIKNYNENESTNKLYCYNLNDSLYGLSTYKLDDDIFKTQTLLIDDKIREVELTHFQGVCKQLKIITNDEKEYRFGDKEINFTYQQISLHFTKQQFFKSLYFDQGQANQLTGHYEMSQNYSFDSIQQFSTIQDRFDDDIILHDINILTMSGEIVGIQGIYRTQSEEIELITGKPYINSINLDSQMNDCTFEVDRQLQEFEVYQNAQLLTLDKIVLKYAIQNKINYTKTKLQMEIGKLREGKHHVISNDVKEGKNLIICYSTVNTQNYLSKIELI